MKNMYTPRQQMSYQLCECDPSNNKPPGWLLDKIATEKMTGGYRRFKKNGESNVCDKCYTTKSVNGTCGCL